jgi:hypothetical protein
MAQATHINSETMAVFGNSLESNASIGVFDDGSEGPVIKAVFNLESEEITLGLEDVPQESFHSEEIQCQAGAEDGKKFQLALVRGGQRTATRAGLLRRTLVPAMAPV